MKKTLLLLAACFGLCCASYAQREITHWESGWKFTRTDDPKSANPSFNDSHWQTVAVPHDWAIAGPFDMTVDAQTVMVTEDGERKPQLRTGRTGSLPFVGTGWYRYEFKLDNRQKGRIHTLEFDGAMSNAKVYVNGRLAGEWPYGYSSFAVDATPYLRYGARNVVAVRLENKDESSRWYPGAGLYRNVRLVSTPALHIGHWGTWVATPEITANRATVAVKTTVENTKPAKARLLTEVFDPSGTKVASSERTFEVQGTYACDQQVQVAAPKLWNIDMPNLYTLKSTLYEGDKPVDTYTTSFGIRTAEWDAWKGFVLNGRVVKLKGVCLHHDLGPLGAAVNYRALERQVEIMREMGCNAIRTSHNPAAPELLEICDRMGMLVMEEAFDEWKIAKNKNGYSPYFDQWAQKDLQAMIRRDRNHPSIIIWSIGNEIREQTTPEGADVCRFLTDIAHREDPTRLVTAGLNTYDAALKNGFQDIVDVFGFNYKPFAYGPVKAQYPDMRMVTTESASTISSRGVYHLPAVEGRHIEHPDYQCSSYDLEFPRWASTADREFAGQDDAPFVAGEFVWTGFDYLGEPTPYNVNTPARSSYFGIVDLAGMKKDRFWLYQSRWSDRPVLHLLPHWNWEGREGERIPVHCYTNYPAVELFVNGISQGRRSKNNNSLTERYRLVWEHIIYQPGQIKAVAYDASGKAVATEIIRTAGTPDHLVLKVDRSPKADGKDLSFVEVTVVDKEGNPCPHADLRLDFTVNGVGRLAGLCNGDPTSHESFAGTTMKAFSGKCMAVVGYAAAVGNISLEVKATGLPAASIAIPVK